MKAEYVDHMGSDLTVANSARVSFSKVVSEMSEKEEKLITYLAKHNHWTPFAHPQITLRMKAPVSIRTQAFKHKVGFCENEESRRYISSKPEIFIPDEFRLAPVNAKQGSGDIHPKSKDIRDMYIRHVTNALDAYLLMIDEGVAPEQARFVLPQGTQVNWIWTGSLAAYARFCKQRSDSHAQKEVQELAKQVSKIIQPLFPVSWKALTQ